MADDVLTFIIAARDMASATLARTSKELRMLGPAAGMASGPMAKLGAVTGGLISPTTLAIGATAALTAGAFAAADAAREDEASIALLGAALKANIKDFDGNTTAIEAAVTARMALGFADETQRESLRLLVAVTKDSTKALDLQRLAMDFARLKNIDLTTASTLVGKVYGGNIGILSRYGIQLAKGTTATEALAELQKRAAGQAEEWASTSEGAAATAAIAFDELTEKVGYMLLPAITALSVYARDELIPVLSKVVDNVEVLGGAIGLVAGKINELDTSSGGLVSTFGGVAQAVSNPIALFLELPDVVKGAEAAIGDFVTGTEKEITSFHPGDALGIMWGEVPQRIAAQEARIYAATHKVLHDPVEQAAVDARKAARIEFAKLPRDIADAVKNNLPDIDDGLDALKDMFKTSLSDTRKIAKLEGILSSKALAKGLRDERFDVRAAAKEVQQNARDELRELKTGAKDAAADGGKTYAQFLKSWRNEAGDAGKQLSDAALLELQIDGRAMHAGYSGGQSFVAGIVSSLIEGMPTVNNAAYRFMAGTLGTSLPKSGPFSHPEKGAISIAEKFTRTLGERLQRGAGGIQGTMPTLSAGAMGLAPGGTAGGLTINFNSTFPATPGQQAAVAEAIGPELERWRRRQGR